MSTAVLPNFAALTAETLLEGLKPRALQILAHILTLTSPTKPIAWVSQSHLAKIIGIHKDTVGKHIRALEKTGRLIFQGTWHQGRHKTYKIIYARSNEEFSTYGVFAGPPTANSADHPRHFHRNLNRPSLTKLIKQTEEPATEKYSEKNLLKQSLRDLGLSSNKTKSLLQRFPQERIEQQIANLKDQLAKNLEINNPAGWLLRAIEKNYHLETKPIQTEQEEQKCRESYNLLKSAELYESRQEYEQAIKLAQQSLAIKPNQSAQELINRIEHAKTQEAHQAQALANIPQEEFERVLAEEIAKQKTLFMRLGIRKVSELHIKAAQAATVERLIQEKT